MLYRIAVSVRLPCRCLRAVLAILVALALILLTVRAKVVVPCLVAWISGLGLLLLLDVNCNSGRRGLSWTSKALLEIIRATAITPFGCLGYLRWRLLRLRETIVPAVLAVSYFFEQVRYTNYLRRPGQLSGKDSIHMLVGDKDLLALVLTQPCVLAMSDNVCHISCWITAFPNVVNSVSDFFLYL